MTVAFIGLLGKWMEALEISQAESIVLVKI